MTGVCDAGRCSGLQIGANCHSHTDCAEGLFCEKSRSWPFAHTCAKLRTSYQICIEDAECVAGAYCWYASAKNVEEDGPNQSAKQCLPYYSYSSQVNIGWKSLVGNNDWKKPTYEDMLHNGQYCVYGVAFPIS